MKQFILMISLLTLSISKIKAQTDFGNQYAEKVAQKMKDSLGLSGQQKISIKNINLDLYHQKTAARQLHLNYDSTRIYLQRIENKRDSLYKMVLTSDQYLSYKNKKYRIVNNK